MVLEIPPTWLSVSNSTGVISDLRNNSSAAVSPAGPAPAIIAIFRLLLPLGDIRLILLRGGTLYEQELATGDKVAYDGKPGCDSFGNQVVQTQVSDGDED